MWKRARSTNSKVASAVEGQIWLRHSLVMADRSLPTFNVQSREIGRNCARYLSSQAANSRDVWYCDPFFIVRGLDLTAFVVYVK